MPAGSTVLTLEDHANSKLTASGSMRGRMFTCFGHMLPSEVISYQPKPDKLPQFQDERTITASVSWNPVQSFFLWTIRPESLEAQDGG